MARCTTDAKDRILQSAYDLFAQNGYEHTTVENIIEASGYSKGTFYHYFAAKEELLLSWLTTFNDNYSEWFRSLDPEMGAIQKLTELNRHVLDQIEFNSEPGYVATVYAAQITTSSERLLAKKNRNFMRILHSIIKEGQDSGELRNDISFAELGKIFVTLQNGAIYEWCLFGGTFSLRELGVKMFSMIAPSFKKAGN